MYYVRTLEREGEEDLSTGTTTKETRQLRITHKYVACHVPAASAASSTAAAQDGQYLGSRRRRLSHSPSRVLARLSGRLLQLFHGQWHRHRGQQQQEVLQFLPFQKGLYHGLLKLPPDGETAQGLCGGAPFRIFSSAHDDNDIIIIDGRNWRRRRTFGVNRLIGPVLEEVKCGTR